MAKKIFRLSETEAKRPVSGAGWHSVHLYDAQSAENIQDPATDKMAHSVTSIPSPLAQFHLCHDAFKYVANKGAFIGASVYHRLVSHTLDLWELFFRKDIFPDLDFIDWDIEKELNTLKHSDREGHRLLAKTLGLYIRDDESNKPFQKINKIALLIYKQELIGGTSPLTGFVPVAFPLKLEIKSLQLPLLSDKYFALYERSDDFIPFMYKMRKAFPRAFGADFFEHLNTYMDAVKNLYLKGGVKKEIITLDNKNYTLQDFYGEFSAEIRNEKGESFYLLEGSAAEIRYTHVSACVKSSDFFLKSPFIDEKTARPLILRQNPSGPRRKYVNQLDWTEQVKIPYYPEESDYTKRRLPGNNIAHPYLVTSDFLEDVLIQLPFPLHREAFLPSGVKLEGFDEKNPFCYLLPIKPLYFSFFSWEELAGALTIQRKSIGVNGQILVKLVLPIENGTIEIERIYEIESNPLSSDERRQTNKPEGGIIEAKFNLALYPYFRVANDDKGGAPYFITLIDDEIGNYTRTHRSFKLQFFGRESVKPDLPLKTTRETERRKKEANGGKAGLAVYELPTAFDAMRLTLSYEKGEAAAFLFPVWKDIALNGQKRLRFAFDFGTTNTYIACEEIISEGEGRPYPFEANRPLYYRLDAPPVGNEPLETRLEARNENWPANDTRPQTLDQLGLQFLPPTLGGKRNPLPFRTVLAHSLPWADDCSEFDVFSYSNIWFNFGKDAPDTGALKYFTDLKWSAHSHNQDRLSVFIKELVLLARNHALSAGARLDQTKLIWLYPLSMESHRRTRLDELWRKHGESLFGKVKIESVTESEGPFYYHRKLFRLNVKPGPLAVIDVGGGTIDLLLVKTPNEPTQSAVTGTSFMLGGNILFGAAPGKKGSPLVEALDANMKDVLSNPKNASLQIAYNGLKNSSDFQPLDLVNFYFKNEATKERFERELQNSQEFKLVLLFYYVAVNFYIGRLSKALPGGKPLPPADICLSGNGSRLFRLLDANLSNEDSNLTLLTRRLYEIIFGEEAHTLLHLDGDPKRASAEGALQRSEANKLQRFKASRYHGEKVYLKESESLANDDTTVENLDLERYAENLPGLTELIKAVLELNRRFAFREYFGIELNISSIISDEAVYNSAARYAVGELRTRKGGEPFPEPTLFYSVRGFLFALTERLFSGRTVNANAPAENVQYQYEDDAPPFSVPERKYVAPEPEPDGLGVADEATGVFAFVPAREAMYILTLTEDNLDFATYTPRPDALGMLLQNGGEGLYSACQIQNPEDLDEAKNIETIRPGKIERREGKWYIKDFAEVLLKI